MTVSLPDYLLLLLAMGAVTYIPRWAPVFFLSRRQLPQWLVDWLDLIPAAILSALLLPELVLRGDQRTFSMVEPELWVAVPTLLFAIKTRSLGGTVVVGMLLFWGAQKLL
ncbi:MAG: AzlD domain-containing protein [Desulfosarcinaceae bacterium]|nr:AzlD domain-containing protein [Desulfosarcinaceae bacterium]